MPRDATRGQDAAEYAVLLAFIAVVIIVVFVAIFYKRHQWDMKEQQYLEMKAKQHNEQTNQ